MTSPSDDEPREPEKIVEPPQPPPPVKDSEDAAEHNHAMGVDVPPTRRTIRNLHQRVIE